MALANVRFVGRDATTPRAPTRARRAVAPCAGLAYIAPPDLPPGRPGKVDEIRCIRRTRNTSLTIEWVLRGLVRDDLLTRQQARDVMEAARTPKRWQAGPPQTSPGGRLPSIASRRRESAGAELDLERLTRWLAEPRAAALPAHRSPEDRRLGGHQRHQALLRRALQHPAGRRVGQAGHRRHRRALGARVGARTRATPWTSSSSAWSPTRVTIRRYLGEFYAIGGSILGRTGRTGPRPRAPAYRASSSCSTSATSTRSTPTTATWCASSTGCCSTPSSSAPATSTSSRAARPATCAFASTACCTWSTSCPARVLARRSAGSRPWAAWTWSRRRRPQDGRIKTTGPDRQGGGAAPVHHAHHLRREAGDAHLRPGRAGEVPRGARLRRARAGAVGTAWWTSPTA